MNELEKYIQTYFGIKREDLAQISSFFKPIQFQKGEYFLKAGRKSTRLGFVQSGIMREYLALEDKEITKWIATQGYFVVELSSFLFNNPARYNIQTLSDCELYIIEKEDYSRIGEVVNRWSELEKLFIAKCFAVLEDRIINHLSMSASERYQQLFNFNKELFNQVPLHYLASMLGITPETLSRLRKKELNS